MTSVAKGQTRKVKEEMEEQIPDRFKNDLPLTSVTLAVRLSSQCMTKLLKLLFSSDSLPQSSLPHGYTRNKKSKIGTSSGHLSSELQKNKKKPG